MSALIYFDWIHRTDWGSWGTRTECNGGCTGTVSAQTYSNTAITLENADTTFGKTIAIAGGATYTGLSSRRGERCGK